MNHNNQQILKNNMRRENDREAQLSLIREKCGAVLGYEDPTFIQDCTYRLADVLLAIGNGKTLVKLEMSLALTQLGISGGNGPIGREYWNLRADNLTEQSDETIQFLADLLTN